MIPFKIKIDKDAKLDIQEGINWYNSRKKGLGREFHLEVKDFLEILRNTQFFQIRYDETRCLPLKRFPYMIHYSVDEKNQTVIVRAVFNTSRNPKIWKSRE
jgi:toxin ParE1/3/4